MHDDVSVFKGCAGPFIDVKKLFTTVP